MNENSKLTFGKYNGYIVKDLLIEDPSYIGWLESENLITLSKAFKKEYGNDIKFSSTPSPPTMLSKMPFGKYEKKTLAWIMHHDISYLFWLHQNTSYDLPPNLIKVLESKLKQKNVPEPTMAVHSINWQKEVEKIYSPLNNY